MPKDVYNLGRASGLSAWEIYVRQSLIMNPNIEPLSEREWLSETIGLGTSMLLKISSDNVEGVHFKDYPLPANSFLCAPNTIIGSFFYGEGGGADSNGWCKKVVDYGPGIPNNSSKSPNVGTSTAHFLPTDDLSKFLKIKKVNGDREYWEYEKEFKSLQNRMIQYLKIHDAVVLQDGVWSNAETNSPSKTFVPDITKPATLRIIFQDKIEADFYILLTGFVTNAIIKGEVGFDMGAVIPDDESDATAYHPENGDFLGPELYPWANKVVFTYPTIISYLLRDGMTSSSKNLEVDVDKNSMETHFNVSELIPGKGIQINDVSEDKDDKRAKKITISSRIQSNNNYVEVVSQDSIFTKEGDGGSTPIESKIPTTLRGSEARPSAGVGITQPSRPGEPHYIGAKIQVSAGGGSKYLGVSQSAPDNADLPATILSPSYGDPGPGIAMEEPAVPGGSYKISSKVASSGEGSDYIGVNQNSSRNADATTTTLTPSKAIAGRGVGVTQPTTPGGKHTIGAVMTAEGCGAKYLAITQPANESRSATDIATTLNPSKIASGDGIAISQPSAPGGDITISSKMKTAGDAANYIKIEQESHDSGCGCGCGDGQGADANTSTLSPSKLIEENDKSRIRITQPSAPGDDIKITTMISFTPHKGISIWDCPEQGKTHIGATMAIGGKGAKAIKLEQASILQFDDSEHEDSQPATIDNAATKLYVSELVVDERNQFLIDEHDNFVLDDAGEKIPSEVLKIIYPEVPGEDIKFYIDVNEIIRRMLKSGPLAKFMKCLLDKIYTGQEDPAHGGNNEDAEWRVKVDEDGTIIWPDYVKDNVFIPMGHLNFYSDDQQGDVYEHTLRSRKGNSKNDIRCK